MRITLVLSLFFILGCGRFSLDKDAYQCHASRVAIDMGSGSTKVIAAKVNKCRREIIKIFEEKNFAFKFKESIHLNKMRISRQLEKKVQEELSLFLAPYLAKNFEVKGVATEVFREALNGGDVVRRLSQQLNISLAIIDQKQEALLGFWGAVGVSGKSPEEILVWDIGGGSMQMTTMKSPAPYIPVPQSILRSPLFYLGKLASVSFKNKILAYQGRTRGSPNPIGDHTLKWAQDQAVSTALEEVPSPIKELIEKREVIGIGGVHYYSIRTQTEKPEGVPISRFDLETEIQKRVHFKDHQIASLYKETDVSNLILVNSFMKALQIKTILPLKVNLATGVLFHEELW